MTTQKTNHADEMKEMLLYQFRGKANFEAILEALAVTIQDVEDMLYALFTERGVDTAIGLQLDILGSIVGETRNNRDDEPYRIAIKTRIIRNVSSGTPDSILEAFTLLFDGSSLSFIYSESYPAEVYFEIVGTIDAAAANEYYGILQDLLPAGVGTNLVYALTASPRFRFSLNDSISETSSTVGFGTTANSTTGGKLAGALGDL